jgi:hypothetical protein
MVDLQAGPVRGSLKDRVLARIFAENLTKTGLFR